MIISFVILSKTFQGLRYYVFLNMPLLCLNVWIHVASNK